MFIIAPEIKLPNNRSPKLSDIDLDKDGNVTFTYLDEEKNLDVILQLKHRENNDDNSFSGDQRPGCDDPIGSNE